MTGERLRAEFVGSALGRIFLLLREPEAQQSFGRCVLFVPPFAEEMNKSRRQMTDAARALVAAGFAVLIVDLYGTGDSEGEFADGTWQAWKADVGAAIEWMGKQGFTLDALVGVRLGCSLGAESLRELGLSVRRSVFWQPVESGSQLVTQFLRLRVAASMMEADRKETVDRLRSRLRNGETLEVAGYQIAPDLWRGLEQVDLRTLLHLGLGSLRILEVGRNEDLSPPANRLLEIAGDGLRALGLRLLGEPFWSATEIVVNPDLTAATVAFVTET